MANQFVYKDQLIKSGDTVIVHQIIEEGGKKRIQKFEGIVISIKKGPNGTFTVRRLSKIGVGVERIFPIDSPWIDKIEVKNPVKTRRAKLYYLRTKKSKKDLRFKKDEKRTEILKQQRKAQNKLHAQKSKTPPSPQANPAPAAKKSKN
ncbi:MAG: 50S ribosomal protein L19 [bacterium]|nr:50S ribosomal protein L19 [bacterium]